MNSIKTQVIIDAYRKSGDVQKMRVAEILQTIKDLPQSQLVKVLFERERLKTEISILREQFESTEKELKVLKNKLK